VKWCFWDEDAAERTEGCAESGFMTQGEGYSSEVVLNLRF
jgi:hypothetical protein